MPELFGPAVAAALPSLFAATTGSRAAVFHDAIALKFPELTPPKTVARFPAYLRELLSFDGIAANSEDSRTTLLSYWDWLGIPVSARPQVTAIPLGIDIPRPVSPSPPSIPSSPQLPTVLSVGSIEGRKNHLALLDACEALWSSGLRFELHLIGLSHPQTGRAALARLHALQSAGRPIRYNGPASDADLAAAYAACTFTVYPSLIEGFGLPVLESLARGKPCVCSARGALGEAAEGGGVLPVPPTLRAERTRQPRLRRARPFFPQLDRLRARSFRVVRAASPPHLISRTAPAVETRRRRPSLRLPTPPRHTAFPQTWRSLSLAKTKRLFRTVSATITRRRCG